jgi:acetyl-CoA acetyltransferase
MTQTSDPVVIAAYARTPMGGFQGALSGVKATELGATAVRAAVERAGVDPARVEQIDGVFYVYDARDGSFLAQGQTADELRDRIETRVKNAQVRITEGEESVLSLLKANLESGRA